MSIQLDQDEVKRMRECFFHCQYGKGDATNFAAILFGLFQKADRQNYARLKLGFPEAEHVYNEWLNSPTEDGYFESHGFNVWERRKINGSIVQEPKEGEIEVTIRGHTKKQKYGV